MINFVSVILFLFCGAIYVVNNCFTVNKIIIQGNIQHITAVQLSYIAKNKLRGTLFTLDISGLKREFMEIPWVRQVSLNRQFPHTIIVTIDEYLAVARVDEDSLVTENGEVFSGADDDPNLPTFYITPDKIDLALSRYHQINQLLAKHNDHLIKLWGNFPQITKFSTGKNLKITICAENLSVKLAQLERYWSPLFTKFPHLNSIDLCYKNAMAIGLGMSESANNPEMSSNFKGKVNK